MLAFGYHADGVGGDGSFPRRINMYGDYLTVSEAARLIPGQPSPSTVWRWCQRGIRAPNGERIRLEHRWSGRRIVTRMKWVEEVTGRVTMAFERREEPPARRRMKHADADDWLREQGL